MKMYLAGPMRGLPEFNHPAFNQAAAMLREAGHEVFNPAERDKATGFDPTGLTGDPTELEARDFCVREALAADTDWICKHADAIYLLPGWQTSTGACAERALGEAIGLTIIEHGLLSLPFFKIRDAISWCTEHITEGVL